MTYISKYISYTEATRSITAIKKGIKNIPTKTQIENMQRVAQDIFDPMRDYFGVPIFVSNFFRNAKLNKIVGGSDTSDHPKGCAIDVDDRLGGGVTNKKMFDWIKENAVFDQLIWEHGNDDNPEWIHFSKRKSGNRGQVLRAYKVKNKKGEFVTKYKLIEVVKK